MRGASSARGTAVTRPVSRGWCGTVGEGVKVDGVGKVTPGLDLLGYFLGVGRGKHAGEASVLEGIRQRIQKLGDGIR